MARTKKSTKKKKTPPTSKVRQISMELKKTIKQQERLATLEQAQQKINQTKIEEAGLLANMMFSLNAIARCLTEKKLEMITAVTDDQGHVLYDLDSEGKPIIKTTKVQIPIVTLQELNVYRMIVVQEYQEERRKELEAEEAANKKYKYNDEEHTASEWAELLGITQKEMDEYLKMGVGVQDIVETLAEENLEPDEKLLICQKVKEAVDKAKAAREVQGGDGKTMGLPGEEGSNVTEMLPLLTKVYHGEDMVGEPEFDLNNLNEEQMERYLETGELPVLGR